MRIASYTVLILTLLCLFSACKLFNKEGSGKVPVISISKTACKGRCPQYTATFYKGGSMFFEGIEQVKVKGKYAYVIPQALISGMLKKAQEIKYQSFKGEYLSADKHKAATITIVTLDGKSKLIRVEEGAPEELIQFQQSLHEEVMAMIAEHPGIPSKK